MKTEREAMETPNTMTPQQQEVYSLYREGHNDVAISKVLRLSRERIRQIRNRLGLPRLPWSKKKPRGNCLVCGLPIPFTRKVTARYCSPQCHSYGESLIRARFLCPCCGEPAKSRGTNRSAHYYKCRSGHCLRRTEDGLVLTRGEVVRQKEIAKGVQDT